MGRGVHDGTVALAYVNMCTVEAGRDGVGAQVPRGGGGGKESGAGIPLLKLCKTNHKGGKTRFWNV